MTPQRPRAAIQGELGSFSHQAARRHFGPDTEVLCCPDFDAAIAAVTTGECAHAVIPVENTLAGAVPGNRERISSARLEVIAELSVQIELCLIARPGTSRRDITRVASHPVALAQCQRFFASHPTLVACPAADTAGSVRDLMRGATAFDAALASPQAAELYGAEVLEHGISDIADNFTRFHVVRRPVDPKPATR